MNDSIYIWIEILWYTLLAVLAVGIPAKLLVNWIRFPCQFCNEKIELFKRIDFYEQRDILDYFRQYENREPDQGGLFVCTKCRTVHDDFSGEKKSWDVDTYGCRTFCKVCGLLLIGCEPDREVVCDDCQTPYHWRQHGRYGYRVFTPPSGARLLAKAPDRLDGHGGTYFFR